VILGGSRWLPLLVWGSALGVAGPMRAVAQRFCRVADVQISPPDAQVLVGRSLPLLAMAYDAAGNPCANATFRWTSSNANAARMDQNGIATGVAPGVTIITARSGTGANAKLGQATIEVLAASSAMPITVANVQVVPPDAEVQVGGTAPFLATAYDNANNPISTCPSAIAGAR
jgi:hypothetical protein